MAGYGTDIGFADYAAAAGYDIPSGNVAAARQRGSTYIDGTYGARFLGSPTGGLDQERAWPRTGVPGIAVDQIPQRVINASYEAALIELGEPGALSVTGSAAERIKRLKAGSAEIEYADGSASFSADLSPIATVIEGLLAPLLRLPEPAILVV